MVYEPAEEGLDIQWNPWPWNVALEPIMIVTGTPVATQTYEAAEVGEVKVMMRLVESMRAPQDVAPLRQIVFDPPFETLIEVGVPFMARPRSLKVMVPRLKSLGNVTETVLDAVVPLREPSL
jgi:hypothetical protein